MTVRGRCVTYRVVDRRAGRAHRSRAAPARGCSPRSRTLSSVHVPEIDIASLVTGSGDPAPAAAAIDAACRDVGFFTIVGHGVDLDRLRHLDALAREFFARPDAAKAEIAMARAGATWRGWFPVGGELTSGRPDQKEGLYFGAELGPDDPRVRAGVPLHGANLFPTDPAGLRDAVLGHIDAMTMLAQVVLEGMALGLGLERGWFRHHLTADPTVLFRIFHYPPTRAGVGSGWGVGEHTDYGLLTILAQDGSGGLQVRASDGWVGVEPRPDRLVCNLGDMLERLTGGRYRSTPHRVRNNSGADRLSFPFFLDPAWDAVVDRLPIVDRPTDDGAGRRWDRTSVHGFTGTYGDYLLGKVGKVFPALAADPIDR
jgi:isopenicillin N synthase-like dioxygenase